MFVCGLGVNDNYEGSWSDFEINLNSDVGIVNGMCLFVLEYLLSMLKKLVFIYIMFLSLVFYGLYVVCLVEYFFEFLGILSFILSFIK